MLTSFFVIILTLKGAPTGSTIWIAIVTSVILTLALVGGIIFCVLCMCCPEVTYCYKHLVRWRSQRSSETEQPEADTSTSNQPSQETATLSDLAPPRYQDVIKMAELRQDSAPPRYST